MKEEAGLAIPLEQLRFDAFLLLTGVVDTQISKNLGHRQNWLPIICSLYKMIEISDNSREYVEGKAVTIRGPNILLGFFAASTIRQKPQPENMLFPSVFNLPLPVQQNGICISDASSCITIRARSFSVKTTLSILTELTEAADFQTESITAFYMYIFRSLLVNQKVRFDLSSSVLSYFRCQQ